MIPNRRNPEFEERPPLGVEFALGRWTRADAVAPPGIGSAPLAGLLISPTYAGERELNTTEETTFVRERLAGVEASSATVADLDRWLGSAETNLIHFVGHGGSADEDEVLYLDGDQVLSAPTVRALDGFKSVCRREKPLVFLNACEVGQRTLALGGQSGFPVVLADIGARAIIAPLWSVDDALASRVAIEIYERALSDGAAPLAEIMRQVRAKAYAENIDTYAAYCFFGDPHACLAT